MTLCDMHHCYAIASNHAVCIQKSEEWLVTDVQYEAINNRFAASLKFQKQVRKNRCKPADSHHWVHPTYLQHLQTSYLSATLTRFTSNTLSGAHLLKIRN